MASPVPYRPELEQVEEGEAEAIASLRETMHGIQETTAADYKHAVRAVHAKGHGIVRGTLEVMDGLPPELAQGLFARPGRYDAILRFSTNPGDILDDSVSAPRGAALKLIGVAGSPSGTQDFVMADGKAFAAPGPKAFLGNLKMLAATTDKVEGVKKVQSALLRGVENALEAVGGESALIKNLGGTPAVHPLGETFYSQTPFRYGDYVAKFALAPASRNLTALAKESVGITGRPDALRGAINEELGTQDSVWELRVQLCTDLEQMPVEDASKVWDEEASPYRAVARLSVPHQQSWVPGESEHAEDALLFTPWHCLEAHRPLGGLNRARQGTYEMSADFRARFNGCPVHEPMPAAAA